jgi:thiamine-monophosphate kinase
MRESAFIAHLLASDPPPSPAVLLGPGDDMAALRSDGGAVLAAIDAVVEGRHFLAGTDLRLVGRKAVLRNLSDVAAMAARPLACVASVAAPLEFTDADARTLLDGVRSAADAYACPLVGGDTAIHARAGSPLVVSVAILATPALAGGRFLRRKGGRLGDLVAVTGRLGGSLDADGGGRHLDFTPRIAEAIDLAETLGEHLHAMIDLSDGLGVDAGHLAEAAEGDLAIEIDGGAVPRSAGATLEQALGDGEDFELCFCCSVRPPLAVRGVPVTVVGRVVERCGGPRVRLRSERGVVDATRFGYEHRSEEAKP